MLTKICDDLYIDLERLECISENEEGKYYLALQGRAPTRITYKHFEALCDIINKQAVITESYNHCSCVKCQIRNQVNAVQK